MNAGLHSNALGGLLNVDLMRDAAAILMGEAVRGHARFKEIGGHAHMDGIIMECAAIEIAISYGLMNVVLYAAAME